MFLEREYFTIKTNDRLEHAVWWLPSILCSRRATQVRSCAGVILFWSWTLKRIGSIVPRRGMTAPMKHRVKSSELRLQVGLIAILSCFTGSSPTMLNDSSSFYLNNNWWTKTDDLYLDRPIGMNTIARFLPGAEKFNTSGNASNHSKGKKGIRRLLHAKVPEIFVAQHSGMMNRRI